MGCSIWTITTRYEGERMQTPHCLEASDQEIMQIDASIRLK
eukprot:CAMPEP_0197862132 /NCGR_PEP_ID=MMETSP1438-20131217/38661_1 /TAXON_ID=1461541 /ORGANISM="Pterosperma sp., Strain CCMP1384" /LENGTH=40 /DNA_ID= /DNA_START= /DNA_END= /DNA_ORIENTATION=